MKDTSLRSAFPASVSALYAEDEIGFLDLLLVRSMQKRLFSLATLAADEVLLSGILLQLPNGYTVSATLPHQRCQSLVLATRARQGGLASLVIGGAAGIKSLSDLYVGMLRSRIVADRILQCFDLDKVYDKKCRSVTRREPESNTAINAGTDAVIGIDNRNSEQADDLINAFVDEFCAVVETAVLTEAGQQFMYFECQLRVDKDNLAKAELLAKSAIDQDVPIKIDSQRWSIDETTAHLRAQLAVKEVEIGIKCTFVADSTLKMPVALNELGALKKEMAKTEGGSQGDIAESYVSAARGLNTLGLVRDVKYFATVYELIAKCHKIVKIDEAKESTFIQVIDRMFELGRKMKLNRSIIEPLAMQKQFEGTWLPEQRRVFYGQPYINPRKVRTNHRSGLCAIPQYSHSLMLGNIIGFHNVVHEI